LPVSVERPSLPAAATKMMPALPACWMALNSDCENTVLPKLALMMAAPWAMA
jgi:hypothetical protein